MALFQFIKLLLQALSCTLHLLDLKLAAVLLFEFLDTTQNIGNLILNLYDLPFLRNRNHAELGVTDDYCVEVACCDLGE